MSSRAKVRSRRSRFSPQRSVRPRIDVLESRALLSMMPIQAHPTFDVGPLVENTTPPSGAYAPVQIQEAYGFTNINFGGVAGNGIGETIAIVDAYDDPNIQTDLNAFDGQYGLTATTVTRVDETGGTSYPATDSTGGWELEESLDVEWAHAMAPGASILLVEASSPNDSDLLTAVNYAAAHANVVSMSWGGSEYSGETFYDSTYFDHAGVAFVASAGDSGAPASWPAASPNVLSVGGTALTIGTGNLWLSETGWSGSGGGPSAYEPQPSYQTGMVTQTSTARATPDVAYDGSPSTGFAVYDSVNYEGTSYGWLKVGGTSAGAPQWSALLAIADQGRALNGQPALDSTSPQQVMNILYQDPADFHDITSGTSTGSPQYSAGPGYDYVTGLGSPMANLVVSSLLGTSTASSDKLVLAAPTAETAGTSFGLTVTAENSSGATDTGYLGTISFSSSDVQAGLPATFTFTAADEGTYTFPVTLRTAGSQSITATDAVTPSITGTESGIAVQAAAATTLTIAGFPTSDTAGAAGHVVVTAYDAYGNVATGYTGTVSLASSDPQAVLPVSFTFPGTTGTHTFAITLDTAGTQSITATDIATSSLNAAESNIAVTAAAASILKVTGFSTDDTAGTMGHVVVTAYDAFGNVATGYTGTVSLASSDPQAVLPVSFTFPGTTGTHTFAITLDTAGAQWITATDAVTPSITGTESGIMVQAGAAKTLTIAGFPTSDTAGAAGHVVVTAYDAYGNVATGYTGTVALTSSDPQAVLPSGFTFTGTTGTHTFAVTLDTAGTQSITATDTGSSNMTGTESGTTVQAGAAKTLTITGFPTSDTAGAAGHVVVTAFDAYGNVATGYTGTVSITSSDPQAVLPSSFTFPGTTGTYTFDVTLDTAGTQSITATDIGMSSLTAAESNIGVTAAPASTLKVTGFPKSDTGGTAGHVVVTAYDAYGNVATGYTGTVSLTSSDPQAVLPASFTFPGTTGTYTFAVTLDSAGTQSITATDTAISSITGTESGILVRVIPQITWSAPAPVVYGTPLGTAQLGAVASVPGTFTYTPAEGAILDAGSGQTLSVTFTPQDTTDYTTAVATATISVTKATPILEVADAGGRFSGSPFPASVMIAGTVAGVDRTPAPSLGNITPTVTYYDGSATAGTGLGPTPPSAPGTYTVVAAFPGDADYSAALSTPLIFTIGKGAATVALAASGGSAVYGQPVSFRATVGAAGGTPSGTVTFSDLTTWLATVPLDGSGTATFATSALSAGSHSITATYNGDADIQGVPSAPYFETIVQAATEVIVFQNSIFRKKQLMSVRLTAEITPLAPGAGVPTGEVTFELATKTKSKVKVTRLGREAVIGGEATLTLVARKVLQRAITIVYSGDTNDEASMVTTPRLT